MKSLPNIIFIITHDTGNYFGCYGYSVKTPNIDRLANEGVIFLNHFSCAPQCTPSRGGILTGKLPHSNGLMGLTNMGWDLPDHNKTIPQLLKKAGYSTHLVGLQHTHHHPKKLGYDTISPRTDFPYMASTVVRRFKKFIKHVDQGEIKQPFFCSVGFFETHRHYGFTRDGSSPFNTSKTRFPAEPEEIQIPSYLPTDSSAVKNDISDFVSSVKEVDYYIGKIRKSIDNSLIKENTIIIFTVDHGIPLPRSKCTLYDPGISVPLIIHMPSEIKAKKVDDLVSNVDILPTLLDLVGLDFPEDLHGNSLTGLLIEDSNNKYNSRNHIYAELTFHDNGFNPIRCLRTKKWKYIRNLVPWGCLFEIPNDVFHSLSGKAFLEAHPEFYSPRATEELYDLELDPFEMNNLAKDQKYSAVKHDLSTHLMKFLKNTEDPALHGEILEPEVPEEGPQKYIYDLETES
ncbi:MAG: sulfatase [Candidatus Lokiarchaeota archaeon]|nr:sulfatase [Candidatus Lokiarchaeota archaeon]